MGAIRALSRFVEKKADQAREMNSLDALVKRAQLSELGFEATPKPKVMGGLFGGGYDYQQNPNFGQVPEGFVRVGGNVVQDPTYQSPKDIAMTRAYNSRAGAGTQLTPGRQLAKDKATADIFGVVEQNNVKRKMLTEAQSALPNVPQGLFGSMQVQAKKMFSPNDPILEDWQKIKMIGTDAQLLNTAKTKGAISDQEMRLFAKAAANDDIVSTPRLKPVLKKLEAMINAEESGMFGAYEKNYGENPREWFGDAEEGQNFASPDEADASGLPAGTIVTVQGRRYQI